MKREIDVTERDEVPWLSVVFGYGPMLPFVAGAIVSWTLSGFWRTEGILLTTVWGAAILAFLAGVRRGLSFRTEGGPALAQIATMFGLFVLALLSLVASFHAFKLVAIGLLLVGYGAVLVLDPIAARQGQAPLFFARLRPSRWPSPSRASRRQRSASGSMVEGPSNVARDGSLMRQSIAIATRDGFDPAETPISCIIVMEDASSPSGATSSPSGPVL